MNWRENKLKTFFNLILKENFEKNKTKKNTMQIKVNINEEE